MSLGDRKRDTEWSTETGRGRDRESQRPGETAIVTKHRSRETEIDG